MKSVAHHACHEDAAMEAAALACSPNLVLQHTLYQAEGARSGYHVQPEESDHDMCILKQSYKSVLVPNIRDFHHLH